MGMRAPLAVALRLALIVAVAGAAGCGSGSPGSSGSAASSGPLPPASSGTAVPSGPVETPHAVSGGAPGSTVSGRYVERSSPTSTGHAVAGVRIGLFPHSFQPGANARAGSSGAGGRPVATATTDADGGFVLTGVPGGVWFLAPFEGAGTADGRWVRVTPDMGAAADLVGCVGCPPRA